MKINLWCVVCIAILGYSPAHAQQNIEARSVENAQRFLVELLEGTGGYVLYSIGRYKEPSWQTNEHYLSFRVARMESVARCVTRVYSDPNSARIRGFDERDADYIKPMTPPPFIDIAWANVTKVEANRSVGGGYGMMYAGPLITFANPKAVGEGNRIVLAYDVSPAVSSRVDQAIRYLDEKCEAGGDTGF